MVDTPQGLAERLREEGARVIDFFNNLSSDQWEVCVYNQAGIWNLHDLLAHFVSSEIGRRSLILNITGGGKGAPQKFDIDDFNREEVKKFSIDSNTILLKRFSQERENLIGFVASLEPLDLDRIGKDPFLGDAQLSDIIKLTYRHLQIHLRDARRFV
jgi:hypothetical protein